MRSASRAAARARSLERRLSLDATVWCWGVNRALTAPPCMSRSSALTVDVYVEPMVPICVVLFGQGLSSSWDVAIGPLEWLP